jgi:cobalt/nickel transport system permease protein
MLARGGDGRLPTGPAVAVPARAWLTGLALPLAAGAVLAAGMLGA